MPSKTTAEKRFHSNAELVQPMHERKQETPIHQVATQLDSVTQSARSQPQKTVERPLPPPPNPKYLEAEPIVEVNSAPTNPLIADVTAPEVAAENSHSNPLYDVQTEGPLTYFNYYFEEMGTMIPDSPGDATARSKINMGLIGAGAIAATVVSGLVIGDIWQKAQAPEEGKPKDASLKQNAAKNFSRPTSVAPERQEIERSPSRSKPSPVPANTPRVTPRKTSSVQPFQPLQAPSIPPAPAIAAPETLAIAPTIPPPPAAPQTVNPTRPPSTSWVTANIPQVSVQEAARRRAALAAPQPERLPAAEPTTRLPNAQSTPLPPTADQANSDLLASPSLDIANPDQGQSSAINSQPTAIAEPQSNSAVSPVVETNQPFASNDGSGLQRLFPVRPAPGERADLVTPPTAAPTPTLSERPNSLPPGVTQSLQDYINLPKASPKTASVSLMPLSQQAAVEAGNTTQVGQFTVRQVNSQEYQKEWLASNKTMEDPDIALAYPAYGFIDYQRQVIVVLQEQAATAPTPPQRGLAPNS